ncbi:MAG: protein-export chaperone SecB [Tidjanibacter sp.]|nr:protein-export chaperone SecB [Tidjanibacter sp.]
MCPDYNILHTFLKKVEFSSPNVPELFFSTADSSATIPTNIDVKIQKDGNHEGLYMVNLQTTLNSQLDSGKAIFNINMIYSALVQIEDDGEVDEVERKALLTQVVPMRLYDTIRVLVWTLTSQSGFPAFMMNDYKFGLADGEKYNDEEDEEELLDFGIDDDDDDSELDYDEDSYNDEEDKEKFGCNLDFDKQMQCQSAFPLGYDWMIESLGSNPTGERYLQIVKVFFKCNVFDYKELPIYKCFYRFLTPIKYNHPNYKECDVSLWPILFQLLFGVCDDVQVRDQNEGLPEIEFSYKGWSKRMVSSLSLTELMSLAASLILDTFFNMVNMIDVEIDTSVLTALDEGKMISKELFSAQFKCTEDNGIGSLDFVKHYYKRIQNCDMQTFGYTF